MKLKESKKKKGKKRVNSKEITRKTLWNINHAKLPTPKRDEGEGEDQRSKERALHLPNPAKTDKLLHI